nr:ARID DNA-binding domain-containing protein [Tanacetum cinerariifolium]
MFNDFKQKGIYAFRDDNDLPRGEYISPQLYKAIEESGFLIVIFSKDYASSSCMQTFSLGDKPHSFFAPEGKPSRQGLNPRPLACEVDKWKEALSVAGDLSGFDLQEMTNGYESKFTDNISNEILKVMSDGHLDVLEIKIISLPCFSLFYKANGNSHIIPGVYYAPEVTLNILSQEQLEKQGFQVTYDGNRCSLSLMFKDKEIKRFDEDRLGRMHNHYMQEYFESISKEGEELEQDTINIKGNLYTTKVQSFTDFVAFLNLVKLDDVVSQEWDYFRKRFNMVVKWFFNHYLNRSLPGNIPPIINGVEIHLFDLYKIIENLGGYLSVHFSQEFDMVGEIMGLSKGNGEEIRRCYMNFLKILTSHYKTARAPRQGNMDT